MASQSYYTDRRWGTKEVPLTRTERLRHWWKCVCDAIFEKPPLTRTEWVAYNPSDTGYTDAPFVERVVVSQIRFDAKAIPCTPSTK